MKDLRFWVQAILPVVYDDSLSYYEFLAKVCAKLNEVIGVDNSQSVSIGELRRQIDNILNGGVIDEKLEQYLEQLIENGELDDIVRDALGENANLRAVTQGYYTNRDESHAEYATILNKKAIDFYNLYESLGMETYMQTQSGDILMKAYISRSNMYKRFEISSAANAENTLAGLGTQTSNYLFLTSGTHGNEKASMWGLYLTIKKILTGDDSLSKFIRNNFNIVVIPCVNPYGIDYMADHPVYSSGDNAKCRYNENDVDLNNNFGWNWTAGDHHGSSAFSEPETQFVRSVVETLGGTDKTNGMFCLDCHNFDPDDYIATRIDNIVYYASENSMDRNIMNRSINKLCDYLEEYYPEIYARYNQYPTGTKRPVSARNFGSRATLNTWLSHEKGYQHVFLFESPCAINGAFGTYDDWFTQADLDIAYQTCQLMVACTAFEIGCQPAKPFNYSPAVYGRTMSGIQQYTIQEIVSRMPIGTTFTGVVTDIDSTLANDLPYKEYGIYKIEKMPNNNNIVSIAYWYPQANTNVWYRVDGSEIGKWKVLGHTNVTGDEISMLNYNTLNSFIAALVTHKESVVFNERFANNLPTFELPGTTNIRAVTAIIGRNKIGTATGTSGVMFVFDSDTHAWMARVSSTGVAGWHQLY